MSEIMRTTVIFPVRERQGQKEVLLGLKMRKYGAGLWNGYGGKLEPGETFKVSAARELEQESKLIVDPANLQCVARFISYVNNKVDFINETYVTTDFKGEPRATEEMGSPTWFATNNMPYKKMWTGDETWVPDALAVRSGDQPIMLALHFDAHAAFLRRRAPDSFDFSWAFPEAT